MSVENVKNLKAEAFRERGMTDAQLDRTHLLQENLDACQQAVRIWLKDHPTPPIVLLVDFHDSLGWQILVALRTVEVGDARKARKELAGVRSRCDKARTIPTAILVVDRHQAANLQMLSHEMRAVLSKTPPTDCAYVLTIASEGKQLQMIRV